MNEPSPAEQEVIRKFCEALGSALRRISGRDELKVDAAMLARPISDNARGQLVSSDLEEMNDV
jgi:hypothetical protein